jgi:1-acyl-sn-glycerol-3-phosphate acyltransferase
MVAPTSRAARKRGEPGGDSSAVDEARVVEIARALALEVGTARAASAVSPTSSLERDVGLGSLERVELLLRLEAAFSRELGDRFLLLDTPREIALALREAPAVERTATAYVPEEQPATRLNLAEVTTLVDVLRRRAEAEPLRVHVQFQDDPAAPPITYGRLWENAARVGSALAARGVRPGDRVAIMLPTGHDFLEAFMGVLAARAVAVPLYPPARLDRIGEYLERQSRILANAEARALIAMPEAIPVARVLRGGAAALKDMITVDVLRKLANAPIEAGGQASDLALIQYTSGSTGDPKGVPLTHANLLANIRAIAEGLELGPNDVAVSWLPLYHDMGLIGMWLGSLVHAVPLTLMSPLAFLARPERWLWAIHQRRATISAAPNFAYELCVRKVKPEAARGLDLSSWRCASNGSESVSAGTLDRFSKRFAPNGFRREALMPVYGLAESSVALCFPPVGRGPVIDRVAREPYARDHTAVSAEPNDASALSFVSVGRPLPEHEVRLVDDRGKDVPDRVVGRLLFRGPSCTAGYFRNPAATARAFSPGGWMDSGDLAYRSQGELFITGRVKDVIIKGGQHLIPQEIEEVAGDVHGVRKGCVAAFGVADESTGTERLIIVAESRLAADEDRARLEGEILASVAKAIGTPPDVVKVVAAGIVPKTPSGKLRRATARAAYLEQRLGALTKPPFRLRIGMAVGKGAIVVHAAVRRVGRAVYAIYCALAWAIALVVLVPPLWLLVHLLRSARAVRRVSRFACRVALAITGCRVRVEGLEHLAGTKPPLVLVANHTSYADAPTLIVGLPLDFVLVAMAEMLRWPIVGTFVRRAAHPTVDRFHPQRSVADAAAIASRLRAGEAVLFFPEGGFAATPGLHSFRLGAFEAAASAHAPVVPIALRGARRVLRAGSRIPHPGRIDIWIGEPLAPDGEGWEAALSLRDRAADAIAAHCGEPRLNLSTS